MHKDFGLIFISIHTYIHLPHSTYKIYGHCHDDSSELFINMMDCLARLTR